MHWNIVEKRRNCSWGAISPLFNNIFLSVVRFSCLKGTGFSLRGKQLFEISEVEITTVVSKNACEYSVLLKAALAYMFLSHGFSLVSCLLLYLRCFVLSWFVPHFLLCRYLRKAVLRDCSLHGYKYICTCSYIFILLTSTWDDLWPWSLLENQLLLFNA